MNKRISTPLAFLIIFLVIAVTVGISIWLCAEKETLLPQNKVVQDETADWQTYRNEEYEFEIKYPQGWHVEKREGIDVGPPYINIMEVALDKEEKEEQPFISINIQDPDYVPRPKDWEDFELGQTKGEISCSGTMGCEIVVWSNNYQDFHIVTRNNPLEDKLTDQILSTFKFLD